MTFEDILKKINGFSLNEELERPFLGKFKLDSRNVVYNDGFIAMSETDKIGYLADYPIYGMVANINAFALGASMINPRIKVHLNWSGLTDKPELIFSA